MSWTDLHVAYGTKSIVNDNENGITKGLDRNGNTIYEDYDTDHNGIKEKSSIFSANSRQELTYDNNDGKLLSKSTYDNDDNLIETLSYEYNDKGKLIKRHKDTNGDGEIDGTVDYRNLFETVGDLVSDIFKK